jgi:predicted amidophosphoribosyltransferase
MTYDRSELKVSFAGTWTGDDFNLFKYVPKGRGLGPNEARRLILDFKDNKPEAVVLVTEIATRMVAQLECTLRDARGCRYIVAAPRSSQGGPGNGAASVCASLAENFAWLTHLAGGLKRAHAVVKSAWAHGEDRPDYSTHIESIRYAGPMLRPTPSGILLFDDVITKGNTSSACKHILTQATGVRRVTGLYLGRTV